MLESVLSPNQSVSNQVLGAISSPGHGTFNSKQQEPVCEYDNNPDDDVVDKENAPMQALEKDTKLEPKLAAVEDESVSSSTSPKRDVEEMTAESPESNSKKARLNDKEESEDDEVESDSTAMVSPPKTSASSKSVDDLLADLAKTKSALQQSKETLKLLKEHQQKLAENGASMTSRIQAFDEELTKLKQTHEENGKELEKVLSIRDSAVATFKAAEQTLQKITSKKDEVSVLVDEAANKENDETVAIADDSVVPVVDEDKNEEMAETLNAEKESPECHDLAEGKDEDICGGEGEIEVVQEDEEVLETEASEEKDEEECEKEAEATAQDPSASNEPEEEADTPTGTDSFETPFDETKSEEGKLELDIIDDKDVQTDSEDEDVAEPSGGVTATIDDALALELQNTDGNDSDDDSLISM
jgi:bifunctional autolysin